jgi:hypothetical protein
VLTATDPVRAEVWSVPRSIRSARGLCLFLAGWSIARPLWETKLRTLPDFYGSARLVATSREPVEPGRVNR